jgi:hypothetical protein
MGHRVLRERNRCVLAAERKRKKIRLFNERTPHTALFSSF